MASADSIHANIDNQTTFNPAWPSDALLSWEQLSDKWGIPVRTGGAREWQQVLFSMPLLLAFAYTSSGGHVGLSEELHVVIAGAGNADTTSLNHGDHALTAFGPWSGVCRPMRFSFVGPDVSLFQIDLGDNGMPFEVEQRRAASPLLQLWGKARNPVKTRNHLRL